MAELSENTRMAIHSAADILRSSKSAVVLTGAGISTASGIPDFRSTDGGLWQRYDPFEVASLTAFRHHPERFFEWMHSLALNIYGAQPNVAHFGLARLEQAGWLKTIISQNIDGLHQRAGSHHVIEIHGSLQTLTCVRCYTQYPSSQYLPTYLEQKQIPYCPGCGGVLKPDLVLFGEQLPARAWLAALQASQTCDMMLVIGSSLEVLPVAGLPMRALENGAHLIVINRNPTYIDVRAEVVFHEDLTDIIPLLVDAVLGE
jgi:NAD-dependent protein deacetylase/lipoamidase